MKLLALGLALFALGSFAQQQPECIHDADACHVGECKVFEDSRFVCEPETYTVMVWPAKCLTKDEIKPDTRMEMLMNADGSLDKASARMLNNHVTYKVECGHIEVRKRYLKY